MQQDALENRVIKAIWALSGLKSSDFISLMTENSAGYSGSKIRGLLSSPSNRNFRKADYDDVMAVMHVIRGWCQCQLEGSGSVEIDCSVLLHKLDESLLALRATEKNIIVLDHRKALLVEIMEQAGFAKKNNFLPKK